MSERRPHRALLALLIGIMVVSWPFNLIFAKIALNYFPALAIASFRFVLAGLIMWPTYLIARHQPPSEASAKPFDRGDLRTLVLLSLFGVLINQGCFVVGLRYTTVGHSALILGMGPILILILAWSHGMEAASWRKIIGLAMSFTGVVVLAVEKGLHLHGTLVGDLVTLCGGCGFAVYTIMAKKLSRKYDSITLNAFTYGISAVLVLPLTAYEVVAITRNGGWAGVSWRGWVGVLYLAVFGSVVVFLIYNWALRYIAASRMGAFNYTHPIVTTSLGVLWFHEAVTRNLIVGGVLVVTGIYLVQSGPQLTVSTSAQFERSLNENY